MPASDFWKGKRVFLTGHTGFKGSWLGIWLDVLGSEVTGYALEPPTTPSLFDLARVQSLFRSIRADIRDFDALRSAFERCQPEVVFHMAAQSLVQASYANPRLAFDTNVMGTVNVLEAIRLCRNVKAAVIVTSDKCYSNREWVWGYRETDRLGGKDPYSSSKACAELVTSAYRDSYFGDASSAISATAMATVRAGNVIGGGDWSKNRLIPDCIKALLSGRKVSLRNPSATRPWQHVLEPLSGYLCLAQRLFEDGGNFSGAWNFGPLREDQKTVEWVVKTFCQKWGPGAGYEIEQAELLPETFALNLDIAKSRSDLGWTPRWDIGTAIDKTIAWTRSYIDGADVLGICRHQIAEYDTHRAFLREMK